MKTPEVGQKVCVVITLNMRGAPRIYESTVTKIGRKWIELDGGKERMAVDSWLLDGRGYSSPGRAYLSLKDYEEAAELKSEWDRLKADLPYKAHDFVTVERIKQARALLGL